MKNICLPQGRQLGPPGIIRSIRAGTVKPWNRTPPIGCQALSHAARAAEWVGLIQEPHSSFPNAVLGGRLNVSADGPTDSLFRMLNDDRWLTNAPPKRKKKEQIWETPWRLGPTFQRKPGTSSLGALVALYQRAACGDKTRIDGDIGGRSCRSAMQEAKWDLRGDKIILDVF